ncbi:EF-hand domain-containing protein [Stenotrophomonas sp. YIM B06876]|uniref:EF-hand domain-containing protein n=1 Tax=Stenotrophomonas sp. YIM B06876 TaxID=3060211 RepID=UPI00273A2442|nr:EF-hand domain-containing protein [Stenotrophomonas sp. YIM B06876]
MSRFPYLLLTALITAPGGTLAQSAPANTAVSSPLSSAPVQVRTQALATGAVSHQVQVATPAGEAAVTVRSIQPDNVVGNYRIDFDALDVDGDGFISRTEAQANPALADEFNALDSSRRGRLDRRQLAGWLID